MSSSALLKSSSPSTGACPRANRLSMAFSVEFRMATCSSRVGSAIDPHAESIETKDLPVPLYQQHLRDGTTLPNGLGWLVFGGAPPRSCLSDGRKLQDDQARRSPAPLDSFGCASSYQVSSFIGRDRSAGELFILLVRHRIADHYVQNDIGGHRSPAPVLEFIGDRNVST